MPKTRYFKDENTAQGVTGQAQAGVNDQDDGSVPERGAGLPWVFDPRVSVLEYTCWVEVLLDAGLALHKPLPQDAVTPDTLAAGDAYDPNFSKLVAGVNTKSNWVSKSQDVVQQMATSTYLFALRGRALRAGYPVPIPGLKTVGGVPAFPAERQFGYNKIVGNFGGVPVYAAEWDLWYYVALPPRADQDAQPNLAEHIAQTDAVPGIVQVPLSQPDSLAVRQLVAGQGIQGITNR